VTGVGPAREHSSTPGPPPPPGRPPEEQPCPILLTGALLSYVLFALGWVLYGLALLRARAVPVAVGLALIVGGVRGYNSGMTPYGVPIGLAVAALGGWLVHRDDTARLATV
jgi:hypothetical protein